MPAATIRSLAGTLAAFRHGVSDPTTRLDPGGFVHATHTPAGPATLRIRWTRDPSPPSASGVGVDAWGPGAQWLAGQAAAMSGEFDGGIDLDTDFPHAVVRRCLAATRTTRIGASSNLYHCLLPTVLAQRITAGEALRQWARLVRALGAPAPGPPDIAAGLLLPPAPDDLAGRPAWWFHRLGIEARRAETLRRVARRAPALWAWSQAGPKLAAERLQSISGIGPWTIGSVLGPACGDADAVPVGDFHFPNIVAWNLAGEPRADDARMLELLAPYAGQRGRVLAAVVRAGRRAPAFGPRRRTLDIAAL